MEVRNRLNHQLLPLLRQSRILHVNISELRARDRPVSQGISRFLYEDGAAGIRYRSYIDDRPCEVLFEGRAELIPLGASLPLTQDHPDLVAVSEEYGLALESQL
jgi:hypothetical protein